MQLKLQNIALLLAVINGSSCLRRSEIPTDIPLSSLLDSAKAHLSSGSFSDALLYYDEAIQRDPSNYLTIFQRGATYLTLGKNSKALADFDRVLTIKPKFENALLQRGRLRAKNADWDGAKKDLKAAGQKAAEELAKIDDLRQAAIAAEKAEKRKDWGGCVEQASKAIEVATTSADLRRRRAKCRFEIGEIYQGIGDLTHVLQLAAGDIEPYLHVSSMLFYSLAETEKGIDEARKCLRNDPDSKACSRMLRREKQIAKGIKQVYDFKDNGKYIKAIDLLVGKKGESGILADVKEEVQDARSAGHIHEKAPDELYTKLVDTTCELYRKSNIKGKANIYCSEALQYNDQSLPGLLWKAEQTIEKDEFEDAIRILTQAEHRHGETRECEELKHKAQVLLKRSKEKDYYKVLGVDRDADAQTIKRSYRKLSKQYHPDRASSHGISKEEAEKKMADLNEAYEVLSDPQLRERFDQGDDPNSHESQQGGHPFQGNPFGQQFVFQQGQGRKVRFENFGFPFGGFPF